MGKVLLQVKDAGIIGSITAVGASPRGFVLRRTAGWRRRLESCGHEHQSRPPALPLRIPKMPESRLSPRDSMSRSSSRCCARCLERLAELGVSDRCVEIHRVPGSFELPVAAKLAARTRRFSAIICLGAVIRGQTPHFDYVAGQAARGIQQGGAGMRLCRLFFGVLTTRTSVRRASGSAAGTATPARAPPRPPSK